MQEYNEAEGGWDNKESWQSRLYTLFFLYLAFTFNGFALINRERTWQFPFKSFISYKGHIYFTKSCLVQLGLI